MPNPCNISQCEKDQNVSVKAQDTPNNAEIWFNKGLSFLEANEEKKALEAFERSIELNPLSSQSWCKKSFVLQYLGNPKKALEASEKALRINHDCEEAWNLKSSALKDIGETKEALEAVKEALRIKPDYSEAWCQKAIIHYYLEQYEEALEAIKESLKLNPNYYIAKSYEKKIKSCKKHSRITSCKHKKSSSIKTEKEFKAKKAHNKKESRKEYNWSTTSNIHVTEMEASEYLERKHYNYNHPKGRSKNEKDFMKSSTKNEGKEEVKRYCIICGKKVNNQKKFCSEECSNLYDNFVVEAKSHEKGSSSIKGFCNICGEKYIIQIQEGKQLSYGHTKCLHKTKDVENKEEEEEEEEVKRYCIICGKKVNNQKKFCSLKCSNLFDNFVLETKAHEKGSSLIKGFCNVCGEKYIMQIQEGKELMYGHIKCLSKNK